MTSIKGLKLNKTNNHHFSNVSYTRIRIVIVTTFVLFMLFHIFRDTLYKMNNPMITLFSETAPNLLASFLFTLIAMFYVLPTLKGVDAINNPMFVLLVNVLNIVCFLLIEYGHVVLNLGIWDNNDIGASLIGIMFSTAVYFILRKDIINA